MTRWMKWVGLVSVALLIVACFLPWVEIPSKSILVTGMEATGTNFGKPGYLHLVLGLGFLLLNFIPRIWAKRVNLLVVGLNTAWAVRNFLIIPACAAGICPDKKLGIFIILGSSVFMLVAALFPDMKLDTSESKN